MHTIVPLWSIPRSVSTGFERMMMERGDFKVIHEPFSYFFYAKEQSATQTTHRISRTSWK
jgi:hypothetical protein